MQCHEAFLALSAALDGELDAEERPTLRRHLGACRRCQQDRDRLRMLDGMLRDRPRATQAAPSRAFVARLDVLLRPSPRRISPFAFGAALTGAAAVGALATLALAWNGGESTSPGQSRAELGGPSGKTATRLRAESPVLTNTEAQAANAPPVSHRFPNTMPSRAGAAEAARDPLADTSELPRADFEGQARSDSPPSLVSEASAVGHAQPGAGFTAPAPSPSDPSAALPALGPGGGAGAPSRGGTPIDAVTNVPRLAGGAPRVASEKPFAQSFPGGPADAGAPGQPIAAAAESALDPTAASVRGEAGSTLLPGQVGAEDPSTDETAAPRPVATERPGMASRRLAAALSIRYSGRNPCRLAIATGTTVAEACALGGVNQAKREMKRILRAAKGKGLRYDCDTCHVTEDGFYHLHPDARDRFDRMLEVTRT